MSWDGIYHGVWFGNWFGDVDGEDPPAPMNVFWIQRARRRRR